MTRAAPVADAPVASTHTQAPVAAQGSYQRHTFAARLLSAPPHGHASNGDPPPLTTADLPTRIPAGVQLPCADALIVDLRPPQLSLLIGKVGLRALADNSLEPLHVALLAERAHRMSNGQKPTPAGEGVA